MPDGFRGTCRSFDEPAGEYYARSVAEKVETIRACGGKLASFFAEGIMGCGGQLPLPQGYLERAFELIREAGGLCVADEVQTGFGRVGSHFWSFELSGVVPDIVTMGKPIANGHPLGAVVTTPAIAAAFNNGMEYFNTFGGNPVSCAIGMEVLKIIADERLQQNSLDTGAYWMDRLNALQADFPIIGQVRGAGLFLGIDLISGSGHAGAGQLGGELHRRAHEGARHLTEHRGTASQCAEAQAAAWSSGESMWICSWRSLPRCWAIRSCDHE